MRTHDIERRHFLSTTVSFAALAAMGGSQVATAAQAGSGNGWAKIVFVLHRRSDLSHDACVTEWMGIQHTGVVGKVPGLRRWVQNHPASPSDLTPDGIGELWFSDAQALEQAMKSAEMTAAVEDAKRFLDLQKTYAMVVIERAIIS